MIRSNSETRGLTCLLLKCQVPLTFFFFFEKNSLLRGEHWVVRGPGTFLVYFSIFPEKFSFSSVPKCDFCIIIGRINGQLVNLFRKVMRHFEIVDFSARQSSHDSWNLATTMWKYWNWHWRRRICSPITHNCALPDDRINQVNQKFDSFFFLRSNIFLIYISICCWLLVAGPFVLFFLPYAWIG